MSTTLDGWCHDRARLDGGPGAAPCGRAGLVKATSLAVDRPVHMAWPGPSPDALRRGSNHLMRCRTCQPLPEEIARAAELLGRRWVLAILWASSEAGAVRFNELKHALETIPARTLAAPLSALDGARGLQQRGIHTRTPPGHEPLNGTG